MAQKEMVQSIAYNILQNIEKVPLMLLKSLQIVYFLSKVSYIKEEDKRVHEIIKKIFEGIELYLTVQFYDFVDTRYINKKLDVLNTYKTYLKLVDYSGYTHFSRYLLEDYVALYRKGKITSSLEVGFYLSRITGKYNIKEYEDVINENINNSINNIYLDALSLKERIDFAKIINDIKYKKINEFDLLQEIENMNEDKVILSLLKTIDEKSFPFGYGAGLGRLLIYRINKQIELL